jgi:hypothetical protein
MHTQALVGIINAQTCIAGQMGHAELFTELRPCDWILRVTLCALCSSASVWRPSRLCRNTASGQRNSHQQFESPHMHVDGESAPTALSLAARFE